MKKSFIFFLYIVFNLFTCFSETKVIADGNISNGYSNRVNDSYYKLEIIYDENDLCEINGILFLKKGKKFKIQYDAASVEGCGEGEGARGSGTSTQLIIKESGIEKDFNIYHEFTPTENHFYTLELYKKHSETYSSESCMLIKSVAIAVVDDIYNIKNNPYILGYNNSLCYFTGYAQDSYFEHKKYELCIFSENVYAIKGSNWYVKKDSKLDFKYISVNLSTSDGFSGHSVKTVLYINDEKNSLPEKVDKDMKIKLFVISEGGSVNTSSYHNEDFIGEINIKIDDTPPEINLTSEFNNFEWIKNEIEVSASDNLTGVSNLEIRKEGEADYVQKYNNGSKILLTEDGIYKITATDGVGNESHKTIKIDKQQPELFIKDKNGNTLSKNNEGWYTAEQIVINAQDNLSEIKKLILIENENQIPITTGYIITKNGVYTIYAEDNAGNTYSEIIKVDNKAPKITKENIKFEKTGEKGQLDRLIKRITVKAIAEEKEENASGMNEVYLELIKEDESVMHPDQKISGDNERKEITGEIEAEDRSSENTYKIKVAATDNAGNNVETEWNPV